jgi:dihydropteroate synthase
LKGFSDGGLFNTEEAALTQAKRLLNDGAHIVDIGGQSTRPGATMLSSEEEIARLKTILPRLRAELPNALLSLDTFYADVVTAFFPNTPIDVVNDVSGGKLDAKILKVVAAYQLPYIVGHLRGTPTTMAAEAASRSHMQPVDFVQGVHSELALQIARAIHAGMYHWNILIDPGIGFAKTTDHCLALLSHLSSFSTLGYPLVIGASRKRFLKDIILGQNNVSPSSTVPPSQIIDSTFPSQNLDLLHASMAASLVPSTAWMIRIHDVSPYAAFCKVSEKIKKNL